MIKYNEYSTKSNEKEVNIEIKIIKINSNNYLKFGNYG
jgi:hypothetical protein